MSTPGKPFDQLSERQQAACYAFAKKYGVNVYDIAPHLDWFFNLANGESTVKEVEEATGLEIGDYESGRLEL